MPLSYFICNSKTKPALIPADSRAGRESQRTPSKFFSVADPALTILEPFPQINNE
jgi:hypothetical protein